MHSTKWLPISFAVSLVTTVLNAMTQPNADSGSLANASFHASDWLLELIATPQALVCLKVVVFRVRVKEYHRVTEAM